MYLSNYENHFGGFAVGFSGVVFSLYPISRFYIEENRNGHFRLNLVRFGRRSSSPSPSPIKIGDNKYSDLILKPYIEWVSLVAVSLIIKNSSFLIHLMGIIIGHLYVLVFEKYKLLSVNEDFALIFNLLFPIFIILYFISYLLIH